MTRPVCAGTLLVRPLERRAGGQRRPKKLTVHSGSITSCEVDAETGLVVTSSESGSVCLWRSAAAMCALGDAAEVGLILVDTGVTQAWILPQEHVGASHRQ